MSRQTQKVVVAVLTYRRPDDLTSILPLLVEQAGSVADDVHVLVIDNDAAGDGAVAAGDFGHPLVHAVVEPRPGIAAARNRALDECGPAGEDATPCSGADLLVFIDDDERPSSRWLDHLLEVHDRTRPAGVVGPVVSEYEREPDEWVAAGRFFDRRRLPTGTEVDVAATNNLLLDLQQVRQADVRFDERFGITGGSDTLFTRQLVDRGGRLVWCDEAVVVDVVPVARLTRDWVLRRAFRSGNSWSRTSLELASNRRGRYKVRAEGVARGAVRVLGGGVRMTYGLLTHSLGQRVRGLRTVARGLGLVAGSVGYTYREYRRSS